MNDWSHGYDVSLGYTYGFCPEMAPGWLDLCARFAGQAPPRAPSAPFRFLELGMGQGMGLCLLAAANPHGQFAGIDFQPEHVAHAEGLATAAGLDNVRFSAADFVALAADWPADLGTFDYVALHGVYSWVSPTVREAVVRCLAHATHADSLVYIGYNTQPGWLGTMPFQHISRLIKQTTNKPGAEVLGDSIALFDRLRDGGADTFQILPGLKSRLDLVRTRSPNYLVHEYLHDSWHPLWHSEVVREVRDADLSYIGSATIAETLLPAVLPPPLRAPILEQQDETLRQDLQDFVINQFFRRDIFRQGAPAGNDDAMGAILQTPIHLMTPPDMGRNLEIQASFGEIALQPPAFQEIVAALSMGPKTVEHIAALPGMQRQGLSNSLQILRLLLQARTLAVGAPDPGDGALAHALNAAIARGAAEGLPYDHLAAAAIQSAIAVTDIELLLLDSWLGVSGTVSNARLADGLADRMARLGRQAQQDGRALEAGKARQHLMGLAKTFSEQTLPRWRGLGAIL